MITIIIMIKITIAIITMIIIIITITILTRIIAKINNTYHHLYLIIIFHLNYLNQNHPS